MTSDIAWSGADCTPGVTPRQLVQSSSENDISHADKRQRKTVVKKCHAMTHAVLCGRQIQAVRTGLSARQSILWLHFIDEQLVRQQEWKNHVIDKTNLMLVTRAF